MSTINLDERRKLLEPSTVTAGGRTYTLPVVLPASMMSAMLGLVEAQSDPVNGIKSIRRVYALLFGEKQADQAMDVIGLQEIQEIIEEAYQITGPELLASAAP